MKIGSLGVCLKCDGKIIYNGEAWRHRDSADETHKAQPKARK